jgi:hypothetical protein
LEKSLRSELTQKAAEAEVSGNQKMLLWEREDPQEHDSDTWCDDTPEGLEEELEREEDLGQDDVMIEWCSFIYISE